VKLFLLFVDGLGLGDPNPAVNPLVLAHMPAFRSLLGGRPLAREAVPYVGDGVAAVATDPRLEVPGLPQSATGQTTIFTGVNAARAIGRHLNGYPTPRLKLILNQFSIFRRVVEAGRTATFLNAFHPDFFRWVVEGQPDTPDRTYRPSASTVAALAAGLRVFRSYGQLLAGEAVAYDIDHSVLRAQGLDLPPVDPVEAGRRAARVAAKHDFTLFEYFLTDKAGHSQSMAEAVQALERLDKFVGGLLSALPPETLLLITSDHGNVEDLSVRTHTFNHVPTIAIGPGAAEVVRRIRSLTDLVPVMTAVLGVR